MSNTVGQILIIMMRRREMVWESGHISVIKIIDNAIVNVVKEWSDSNNNEEQRQCGTVVRLQ